MSLVKSVVELVGQTPLLEAKRLTAGQGVQAKIFAKLEYLNPTGSVKDRAAAAMLEAAEAAGLLKEGSTIIEPTSGNTGIGLASMGAVKGYQVILVMPETMTVERRNILKAYGAKLYLTDGAKGMKGAIAKAEELLAKIDGAFMPSQFENKANTEAHYRTTGPEIWSDLDGQVDVLVAGIGTGGTLTGTGRYLREKNPNLTIVGVEPAGSPFLSKGCVGPHRIYGIGAGFRPGLLDLGHYDRLVTVDDMDAFAMAKEFGRAEGILVGVSSGAALHAAYELARQPEYAGKNIVVVLPDSADRYFSTPLFVEN